MGRGLNRRAAGIDGEEKSEIVSQVTGSLGRVS